jgi:hypothetical protein
MRAIDHNTVTDAVIEQMSGTPNPRLKQIMEGENSRNVRITPIWHDIQK